MRGFGREDGDLYATLDEMAQDIVLGSAVEGDDMQSISALDGADAPIAGAFGPIRAAGCFDRLHPIRALHLGRMAGAVDQRCIIQNFGR